MRTRLLILVLVVAALIRFAPTARLAAGAACGIEPIKPIPPIGCKDLKAVCVVDRNGNSHWQWVCVPE